MTTGRLNRLLGWLLLTVTFLASAALDGWSLSFRDPVQLRASPSPLARHAQAVALGMAFFQLLVGLLLSRLEKRSANAPLVAALTMAGSLLYVAGYGLFVVWPYGPLVAAAGAVLNAVALFALLPGRFDSLGPAPRVAVVVLCGGMLLDLAMALAAAPLGLSLPAYAADVESVQMRMLRLARAAMIALPLLSLLYAETLEKARPVAKWLQWAGLALTAGAATMSLNLVLAACVWTPFKYLLGGPANAAVVGVLAGCWLAFRRVSPFDLLGWLFVLLSMNAGLLMGLYAFDGPAPNPDFLGTYNDFGRRVSRLIHAYAIIYGMIFLNLQRDLPPREHPGPRLLVASGAWLSAWVAGWTIAYPLPDLEPEYAAMVALAMAFGTLTVALGLGFCLPALLRGTGRDVSAGRGAEVEIRSLGGKS